MQACKCQLKTEFAVQNVHLGLRINHHHQQHEMYPVSIEAPPTSQQDQHPPTQQSEASPQPLGEGLQILAVLRQGH